eukprot:TRINITY_DN20353_c0_g1_i3.p1 TRINITY_DN20353_c0_g1~~TRINITY_DN20353_c0_g1_i3.p1  ORF type:complete len:182 (-),score=9.95 TRINITY_DN20353_c0_g1_i3:119-664(-)
MRLGGCVSALVAFAMAADCVPLILFGRSLEKRGFEFYTSGADDDAAYSEYVRTTLIDTACCGPGSPLTATSSKREWTQHHAGCHLKAIGIGLCRLRETASLFTLLSKPEIAIRDYWQCTASHQEPLVFFDLVDAACLDNPVVVFPHALQLTSKSLLFEISTFSFDGLLNVRTSSGAITILA